MLAGILAVLTCVLLLMSILAVWAGRTVLDTERVTAAVDASLTDPVVLDALSDFVAAETTTAIEASGIVERLVPEEWTIASAVVERALVRLATDRTDRLVRSERVHELVVEGTRRAHAAALRVLDAEEPPQGGLVVARDGRVDLNLLPVVALSLQNVQRLGLLSDVELPTLTREMTVEAQNEALGDALGVDLRDDLGQITIYERDVGTAGSILRTAQRALEVFRTSVVLLVLATVLLGTLAVALAPRPLRLAAWLAGGALVVVLVTREITSAVVTSMPEAISDPEARAAARVVVGHVVGDVDRTVAALAGVSLLALAALLGWDWVRAHPSHRQRAVDTIAAHPDATRAGALAVAALVILVGRLSVTTAAVAVAVGVAGWVSVAWARGATGAGGTIPDEVDVDA